MQHQASRSIEGMTCAAYVGPGERALRKLPKVAFATSSLATEKAVARLMRLLFCLGAPPPARSAGR